MECEMCGSQPEPLATDLYGIYLCRMHFITTRIIELELELESQSNCWNIEYLPWWEVDANSASHHIALVAQWRERLATNQEVGGSNPSERAPQI